MDNKCREKEGQVFQEWKSGYSNKELLSIRDKDGRLGMLGRFCFLSFPSVLSFPFLSLHVVTVRIDM